MRSLTSRKRRERWSELTPRACSSARGHTKRKPGRLTDVLRSGAHNCDALDTAVRVVAKEEVVDGTDDWRHGTGLRGRDDGRDDPLPRMARRLVGGALFAPEGLHAGRHDRARLHGV